MAFLVEKIPSQWLECLEPYWRTEGFYRLGDFVEEEYTNGVIYPTKENIFALFKYFNPPVKIYLDPFDGFATRMANISVVLLAQDPYPGTFTSRNTKNEPFAIGRAFSIPREAPLTESLKNIFKEMNRDLGPEHFQIPTHGNLDRLMNEGVFLLNSCLTVRPQEPRSHSAKGWETFTDGIISLISSSSSKVVFLLWGGDARTKKKLIDSKKHLILETSHPSPNSVDKGFSGCSHFSRTNHYLVENGKKPIRWNIINQ